jgi:phage tail-like protein
MSEHPYRQLNFTVRIEGIDVAGFQKVSGLAVQMETETYEEGGRNRSVHHLPGQFSHSNLVLERGLTNRTYLWDWIQKIRAASEQNTEYRRNVTLKLQAGYRTRESRGWQFKNAYPVQWEGPDLLGDGSGDVAIQSLELAHDGFSKAGGE